MTKLILCSPLPRSFFSDILSELSKEGSPPAVIHKHSFFFDGNHFDLGEIIQRSLVFVSSWLGILDTLKLEVIGCLGCLFKELSIQ